MSIQTFGDWLYATPVATNIRESGWVIPTLQSIHILAIAIVVGSAVISELRMAGVLATDQTPRAVLRRYLPWMWWALLVLLLSGSVLIVAEPARTLGNTVFWVKMALVASAALLMFALRRPLLDPRRDDTPPARPVAWFLLATWALVIFCGRFIAYT